MANIKGQQHGQGPFAPGPKSFLELIGGFAVLAAYGAGIYVLFHLPSLLAVVGTILAGSIAGPLPLFGEIAESVALGMIAGLIVGIIRLQLDRKSDVLDELVGAILSPEAITAAQVRWSAAALAVGIGAGTGLAIGRLGILGSHGTAPSVVGPLLAGACFWGCPSGTGGGGDVLVVLFAITLVVMLLAVIMSFGVTLVLAATAKGLATGAAQGGGRAIGIAAAVALSRLRWTALTNAGRYGRPGKLTFETASAKFVEGRPERREIVPPFLDWLRSRHIPPASMGSQVDAYCAQSARTRELEAQNAKTAHLARRPAEPGWNEQKHLRVPRGIARRAAEFEKTVLRELAVEVPRLIERQDPTLRIASTDGAPAFDGSTATLFHQGYLGKSLLTGIREGAIVGAVGAVLSLSVLVASR
jgi:hypothetical protein